MSQVISILVLDDDEGIRSLLKDFFESYNYDVTLAENAKEALDLFKEQSFHVFLTDIIMPEKDGLEVILEVRELLKKPPLFIAMSGESIDENSDKPGYLQAAQAMGADHIITKPFDLEALRSYIEKCL